MNLEDIMRKVCGYLEEQHTPYVVVGGWAAIAWGRQRTTFDIDLIVNHKHLAVDEFCDYLNSINLLADPIDVKKAIQEQSHVSILYKHNLSLRIDFKGVYKQEDYEAIQTARKIKLGNQTIQIGSPENLIAHKLKFGSEQDLDDALIVFKVQKNEGNLDMDYLKQLAQKLKVTSELKALLAKAQTIDKL